MRKGWKWLILLIACTAMLIIDPVPAEAVSDPVVKVGIFDYKAFYGENAEGVPCGYGYEYLNTLEKYGNFQFQYVYGNWAECLDMLEKGEIDLLDSAQKSPERADKYLFSAYSTGTSYGELYVLSDSSDLIYNDFPSMDGLTVGMLEGNSRNNTFFQYAKKNRFSVNPVYFKTSAELSSALSDGRVDAIVSSNLRQGENERPIARFSPTPFYIMMNRDNTDLKERIDEALEEILIDYPNFNAVLNDKYYMLNGMAPMLTKEEHEYIRNAPVLKVVYDSYWPPFESYNIKSRGADGINVDILNLISAKTGLKFEYLHGYSYGEAINLLNQGEADMLLCYDARKTEARQHGFEVTSPFISVPTCFVGRGLFIKDTATFVIPENYPVYINYITNNFANSKLIMASSSQECFKAVADGKADFTMENVYVATQLLNSGNYKNLSIELASPLKDEYSFAIRDEMDQTLLRILDKGIGAISESEFTSIFTSHTINKLTETSIFRFVRAYRGQLSAGAVVVCVLLLGALAAWFFRQQKNKQRLWKTAYIDSLTGIGNLNLFVEDSRRLLDKNHDAKYVVCKFDIQNLKLLNEIYGFERGDEILKKLAETLSLILDPEVDAYARISGDDFIVLKRYGKIEDNEGFRIRSERIFFGAIGDELEHLVKLKFGVYYIQDNAESISAILEKANYAHSICKITPNLYKFVYDESIKQRAIEEKRLEARMSEAILKKQFMLYLQPKYYLLDESIAGAEALVRWSSEDGTSIVYPNSFIPLFEKNGFITKLDMYMLERACELIRSWMDSGITPVTISINFSRLHLLNPNFTKEICEITDRFGIERKYIEIELTESTMFKNEEIMLKVLEELHESGFTLSMDDFGSGYSSLGLLKNLPVDVIKIDRQFFSDNRFKSRSRTVIENVMQMAKKLNIHTVAEGVETKEHIDFLRETGCDIVQGYYYSKPVPVSEFRFDRASSHPGATAEQPKIKIQDTGDLSKGRPEMGSEMPVFIFRLYQTALRKMLRETYGEGEMVALLRNSGRLAGGAFAREMLDLSLTFPEFAKQLSEKLVGLKIGKLVIESFDEGTGCGVLTIMDDLDCSGIGILGETLCQYDEGFIAGILNEYTKKNYSVTEVDCWGTGADVCRFQVKPK